MCQMATITEIESFLCDLKKQIKQNNGEVYIVDREQNTSLLTEGGFTKQDVVDLIINELNYKDYSKGPEEDDDITKGGGDVWVFNKEIWGFNLYFKLKYIKSIPVLVKIISIHEATREMKTPYR